MKIRVGFVSNSSSCSFVISKDNLNPSQLMSIQILIDGKVQEYNKYPWEILEITNNEIYGSTIMDNFDMPTYLENINIPDRFIKYTT